jgi:large subunit ribosomal protein L35
LATKEERQFLFFTENKGFGYAKEEEDERIYKAMPRNRSNPKKKLKTHRGAAKRFKITGTGKLLRMHSGKRHLLGTKAPKRMRKLKKLTKVNDADFAKTMQMLPYGLK